MTWCIRACVAVVTFSATLLDKIKPDPTLWMASGMLPLVITWIMSLAAKTSGTAICPLTILDMSRKLLLQQSSRSTLLPGSTIKLSAVAIIVILSVLSCPVDSCGPQSVKCGNENLRTSKLPRIATPADPSSVCGVRVVPNPAKSGVRRAITRASPRLARLESELMRARPLWAP